MKAIVSLALACNIIKVISFVKKAMHEWGLTIENQRLKERANYLDMAAKNMRKWTKEVQARDQILSPVEAQLWDLAKTCGKTVSHLQAELQKVRFQKDDSGRVCVIKYLRTLWSKGKLRSIEQEIDQVKKAMDSSILISMKFATLRVQLAVKR